MLSGDSDRMTSPTHALCSCHSFQARGLGPAPPSFPSGAFACTLLAEILPLLSSA